MVVNCEHVWQEISNYLEGDVDPTVRAAMEAHFKECKHCTAVLDGTRNIVQLYGDDRLYELPAGFSQRLERRLAQQTSSVGYRSARSLWILAVAAAAMVAGSLTLGSSPAFKQPDLRSHLALPSSGIPPTLMVVVSDDGKVFHVPGCKFLHKHDDENPVLMTAADALRKGYAPCVRCLRQYLSERVACRRLSATPELRVEAWSPCSILGCRTRVLIGDSTTVQVRTISAGSLAVRLSQGSIRLDRVKRRPTTRIDSWKYGSG